MRVIARSRATTQSHRRPSGEKRLPIVHEASAGGVVIRRRGGRWHVALLKTRHTRGEVWVLPKGHIEHHRGETRDVAAVREVREELGIARVRVVRKLGTVRWQFLGTRERGAHARAVTRPSRGTQSHHTVRIFKTVHHYLMEGLTDRLSPQKEEGFLEARWVPIPAALKMLAYPTDREVVAKVLPREKPKK